jgi:hypothetical protein
LRIGDRNILFIVKQFRYNVASPTGRASRNLVMVAAAILR